MIGIDLFGIVSGIVFMVAGWALPELWSRFWLQQQLRLAGKVFPTNSSGGAIPTLNIRASFDEIVFGTNPPTLRGYTHSGDVQGVMSIAEFFDNLPVEIEFDYFPEIRDDMKNVVIVGVSSRSDVARDIGAELYRRQIRIRGDQEHAHFRDEMGREYRCEHKDVGGRMIVTRDVGIIFRKMTDTGATILLCGGLHTFGSQAAAEVALSKEFQRKVKRKRLNQFVQFVTVDVMTSGDRAGLALVRQSIRWKDLPLQPVND